MKHIVASRTACSCSSSPSHKAFDFGSQNPVFGLFIAFVVLAVLDWVAARYQKSMKIVLSVGLVLIGLLWDLLLRVGLRQHMMSVGSVTLGFVLIFTLMRQHENSMMFTAGLFGAVMMIMALHSCIITTASWVISGSGRSGLFTRLIQLF